MARSTLMRNVAGSLAVVCTGRQWHNVCVQVFVACSSFGALVYLVLFALVCAHDIHARFWLGDLPAYALWASALALAPLLLLLGYGAYLTLYRSLQRRARGASSMGGRHMEKQFDYVMTARQVSFVCAWVLLLSLTAVVLGAGVLYTGSIMSEVLSSRCGEEGISEQLDNAHSDLVEFRRECYASPEGDGKPVNLCPGFREAFPPLSPFPTYLKVLEENLECAGFCKQIEIPLFAPDTAKEATQEACGARLARVLWKVSFLSGVPSLVVGCLGGLAAWALFRHDEL